MIRQLHAAVVLAGLIVAGPAWSTELRLAYDIRLGGFSAGSIDLKVELTDRRYSIEAETRSRGLVDALIGFRSQTRSFGERQGTTLRPAAHTADNQGLGEPRRVRIAYGPDGVSASAEPPPELDDRDPVPLALTKDAVDPLTAALQAALAAEAGRPCEDSLQIFDGRRRYALHFVERRSEGEALRCRIRLERIAGMSHDPWLPVVQPIETAELWLARLRPELPPIPRRLLAETAFGAAIVELTALDGAKP
jgi:hypothetical protein